MNDSPFFNEVFGGTPGFNQHYKSRMHQITQQSETKFSSFMSLGVAPVLSEVLFCLLAFHNRLLQRSTHTNLLK